MRHAHPPRSSYVRSHILSGGDMRTVLEPSANKEGWVNSKVVATLGPSSHDVHTLEAMLRAGMSVARIDLTWGTVDYHRKTLQNLQEAMKHSHKLCAVMVDTLGREVMVRRPFSQDSSGWPVHHDCFTVLKDEEVKLLTSSQSVRTLNGERKQPEMRTATVTYEGLPSLVQPNDIVYVGRYLAGGAIEEGSLYLKVLSVDDGEVLCKAQNTAELCGLLTVFLVERSESGVENMQSDLPVFSQYDCDCLSTLASEFEIDFVCTSLTRSGDDVRAACMFLSSIGLNETQIVAKVETRQALLNFESILESASAIIMSRGVLGLDVAPEKMALVQKAAVAGCNMVGKPAIITRALDTMQSLPRPTRAEATDVANIVLDGADGVLLGAETLRGEYPAESIAMAVGICRQAEGVFDHRHHYDFLMESAINAMQATAPSVQDVSDPHNAFMWQLDKMVEEGYSSCTRKPVEELLPQVAPAKAHDISYKAHPSYSNTEETLAELQHQQQAMAESLKHQQHALQQDLKQVPVSPQQEQQQRQQKWGLEHPKFEQQQARGEAEMRRAAQVEREQQPGHKPLSLHLHTKPTPNRRERIEASLCVDEANGVAEESKKRPVLHGEDAAAVDKAAPAKQAQQDGPHSGSTTPDVGGFPSGPLPEGPPSEASIAASVMAKVLPGSGTATPGLQKEARSPSMEADLDSTLQAMVQASGGKKPPLTREASTSQSGTSSSHGTTPRISVEQAKADEGDCPSCVRQADVVPGAKEADVLAAKAELDSAYNNLGGGGHNLGGTFALSSLPYMSKLESITSSAVRAAEKARASLILVFTHTSRAAQLVAKYRPPMPILTLVVPRLVSDGLKWKLEGRSHARQCLLTRGLLPMLSAPGPTGDQVLEEAVTTAARWGLVAPHQHVVVLERVHEHFCVKIVAVDELGLGIKKPPTAASPSPQTPSMRGPGKGFGTMTPQPRSMIPVTPQTMGRPFTTLEGITPWMTGGGAFGGGIMSPARTPRGAPVFSSPAVATDWLNNARQQQQLHPSTSDGLPAASAAVQDLMLPPRQWGRHHAPASPPRTSIDQSPPFSPPVSGPAALPKQQQDEPFGSYADLRLPPGPEMESQPSPDLNGLNLEVGGTAAKAAAMASGVSSPGDTTAAQPPSAVATPANHVIAGAVPASLLLPAHKIEEGIVDQAPGYALPLAGPDSHPLHGNRHPSMQDLIGQEEESKQRGSTQAEDDLKGGMETRTTAFSDSMTDRHPGDAPIHAPTLRDGGPLNLSKHIPSPIKEEDEVAAQQPKKQHALSPFLLPDPDAPFPGSPPPPPNSEGDGSSTYADLAQALKSFEQNSGKLEEEESKASKEQATAGKTGQKKPPVFSQIGTSPVLGGGHQAVNESDAESLQEEGEGAEQQWGQVGTPAPPPEGQDSSYTAPSKEASPEEEFTYFEIPPGFVPEQEQENEGSFDMTYADNFNSDQIRAGESRSVWKEQAPPEESHPEYAFDQAGTVQAQEEDERVAPPGIGSPGKPARSTPPATPRR